jgi:formylglycine-generating enzyme required for sulfatase activity
LTTKQRQNLLLLGVFLLGLLGGFLVWKLFLDRDTPADLPAATNSLGMAFRQVPAGSFLMGSPPDEADRDEDEDEHKVEITRPFHLGVHEVTQAQFQKVMDFNPSVFKGEKGAPGGPDHPVENVSWHEAVDFCRRLSELPEEKKAGRRYRLPTEAEWEYACRAGKKGQRFGFGGYLTRLDASTIESADLIVERGEQKPAPRTTPVTQHRANRWGFHDLHGNVWEWCADWYAPDYYRNGPRQDPPGPTEGERRVIRGGSRVNETKVCRSANRASAGPDVRLGIGVRVVMVEGEGR